MLDLLELEAFLVVAEELHFGHAADRLRLSQSRTSRLVAALERRVGAPLFERTSRRVALTPLGERLQEALRPTYARLTATVEDARRHAANPDGELRAGFHTVTAHGAFAEVVEAFERRWPASRITLVELPAKDPYGPLERAEVDVLVTWRPVHDLSGLVTGTRVDRQRRVVMVGPTHPLAAREWVSVEDLADWPGTAGLPMTHPLLAEAVHPEVTTPSGRRLDYSVPIESLVEAGRLVNAGRAVHLTVEDARWLNLTHEVVYVPVKDLPPLDRVLMWRAGDANPLVARLAAVAADRCAGRIDR